MTKGKKTGLLKQIGNVFFIDDTEIGKLEGSVGPHGTSTGAFRTCESTTPITEIAETKFGIVPGNLFWERDLKPVDLCL